MIEPRLRWALMCVAATSGVLLAPCAEASRTIIVKPGDSLDVYARRYNVPKQAIAVANGIDPEALLRDGRSIVIPDPPRAVNVPPTCRTQRLVRSERVAIRIGPGQNYSRLLLIDRGMPVTVTATSGEWNQIRLANGKSGWIRGDFLAAPGTPHLVAIPFREDAPVVEQRAASQPTPSARRRTASRDESSSRRRVRTAAGVRTGRYRRHSNRPESEAPSASSPVIRTAYAYRGAPYRYGGTSRRGFDCSGFTSHVYGNKGVDLPHNAAAQFSEGRKVPKSSMKPGDLVFFHTTRRGISHVGIYAGAGKFVHASSAGGRVRVDRLDSGYYKERFRGARRVK